MHSPNEERNQGSNEFYKNEFKKGFQIANEVLNQNNFLMEDTLDGINCSQRYGMNVDVAFAGEDKKLIIELFMSEFEKPILFM